MLKGWVRGFGWALDRKLGWWSLGRLTEAASAELRSPCGLSRTLIQGPHPVTWGLLWATWLRTGFLGEWCALGRMVEFADELRVRRRTGLGVLGVGSKQDGDWSCCFGFQHLLLRPQVCPCWLV